MQFPFLQQNEDGSVLQHNCKCILVPRKTENKIWRKLCEIKQPSLHCNTLNINLAITTTEDEVESIISAVQVLIETLCWKGKY